MGTVGHSDGHHLLPGLPRSGGFLQMQRKFWPFLTAIALLAVPGIAPAAGPASPDALAPEDSTTGKTATLPGDAQQQTEPAVAGEAMADREEPASSDKAPSPPDEAAAAPLAPGFDSLALVEAMYEFEAQLDQLVVSGTKTAQRVTQVPAVVTVISHEEIQARGFTSLAEVLRTVPGFYDVYDLTTHNFGIRGINGGARASGSLLKLMIDGQAVAYRPSTGNLFGEELVPLEAVERVEVIRGPVSALYGANAFLGVINVITRSGESASGFRMTGRGGLVRGHLSGGGGLMLAASSDKGEVLVAGSLMHLDRSGLTMPETSPLLARGWEGDRTSSTDLARPKSLFAKASYGTARSGRASLLASVQSLDAAGEFQDFAPLTHGTRIGLVNQTYRLALDRELESVAVRLAGSYFRSSPSSADRLDLGSPGAVALRDVGTDGFEVSAEARVKAAESLTLTAGADFQHEDHLLQSFDTLLTEDVLHGGAILRPRGTIIPSENKGSRKRFDNLGAFLQALYQVTDSLGLTAGLRADRNSVYGTHLSPRLAGVFAPPEGDFNLKLLYGASFKAPSAEQLYTEPMQPFDVRGNEKLGVQKAQTGELAGGLRLGDRGELSASLFLTKVTGRVDYVQRGLYLSAQNLLDEWYTGGELDVRLKPLSALSVRLGVGVARVVSSEKTTTVVITGGPEVRQPLFPLLQAHLAADYVLPFWQLRLSPEVSFVSAREASQSNALLRDEAYSLPAYVLTALALSMPERRLFGERPTRLTLRVANVLGTAYADPGFNGIDLPAPGRTVLLTLTQGI